MKRRGPKFAEEESQLLNDFERGELVRIEGYQQEKRRLEAAARRTLQEDRPINVRLSSHDLERIRHRAAAEGIPYQTLIANTLHKLAAGQLKEAK